MLSVIKLYNRPGTVKLLAILSIICFLLSLLRVCFTGTNFFLFLNWNLFLAFIPWLFTVFMIAKPRLQKNKLMLAAMLGVWLLFFPNAPYILTDLFHLRLSVKAPIWFDLVLILSFAWTGLLFGFISLFDIERMLSKLVSKRVLACCMSLLLFLASFGIYLGRYLRWNSWDIISEPTALLYDIGDRFINPLAHPRTWGVTLFMGLFLNMVYFSIKVLRNEK